jgi:asparagine synthase (glutamine-hydrolysing)
MSHQKYLESDIVRPIWRNHLQGPVDEKNRLWMILMFQSWLQAHMTK